MDLVHYHHLVLGQCPVMLDLTQQQPLCQEQQFGGCGPAAFKADLVSYLKVTTTFSRCI